MNIVDRRLNPKGKSLGNRQRFLTRARAEVKGAVQRRRGAARSAISRRPRKYRSRPRASPSRAFVIRAAPGSARSSSRAIASSSPATRSATAERRRRRRTRRSQRGRRGRGRFRVRAVQGRVPRPVFRRPRAARPGRQAAQGRRDHEADARGLHGIGLTVEPERRPDHAEQHGAADLVEPTAPRRRRGARARAGRQRGNRR